MFQETIDLTILLSSPPEYESTAPTCIDSVTAVLVIDCRNALGEGIIFDDRINTIFWTDILDSKLHSLVLNYKHPTHSLHTVYNLPKKLASFGLLIDQDEPKSNCDKIEGSLPFLCAWEDGFQLYDMHKQKELSEMSTGEDVNPLKGLTRLNDGRVDPTGNRFVCGGFYGNLKDVKMKVYRVEQKHDKESTSTKRLQHEPIIDSIQVTNSICWGLDGKTMYFSDSPTRQINSYAYDLENGNVYNKRVFHSKLSTEVGVPDGSCVDAEGYIWNAVWKNGVEPSCVQRIDPHSGIVTFTVHIPDTTSQVSCCCFGGETMDLLFITTARESCDTTQEPHAGGLYAVRVPFRGRKETKLNFTY
jgi:L-arabinonolactonase